MFPVGMTDIPPVGGGSSNAPSWVPNPSNPPDFAINWTTYQVYRKGQAGLISPDAFGVTTTRASVKQVLNSSGSWTQFANNTNAWSNLGLSVEEARTNSIRVNDGTGAVIGAVLPTQTITAPTAATFTDGSGNVWGFGGLASAPNYTVLKNGVQFASGSGVQLQLIGGGIYVENNLGAWYQVTNTGYTAALSAPPPGANIQPNGNFALNPINAAQNTVQNYWAWQLTPANGASSVAYNGSNGVILTGDGTNYAGLLSATITTVAGQTYTLTADITGSGSNVQAGTNSGGGQLFAVGSSVGTGQKFQFVATTTTTYLSFYHNQSGTPSTIANVSVTGIEEVYNGNFALNPLNGANGFSSSAAGTSTITWNSGAGTVTQTVDASGDASTLYQATAAPMATVVGVTYTLKFTASGGTSETVRVGTTQLGTNLLSTTTAMGTGLSFQFTATTTTTFISLINTTASTAVTLSNVSVQSAGQLPTYLTQGNGSSITTSVVGIGTYQGINTVDLAYGGVTTTTSVNLGVNIGFDLGSASASYGQTWTGSLFAQLVAGSFPTNTGTGTPQILTIFENGNATYHGVGVPITSSLSRIQTTTTLTQSPTTYVGMQLWVYGSQTNPSPVSFTLRIGWPQLENNSLINSSVASAVTAANGSGGVNGTAVYTVGGGTGSAATLNVTWAAGVLTVNSVNAVGSYSVFPPSPATLTYLSGTATGWTGATVNLTPTNNSASGFATSPIITSGSAATRAADVVSMSATFGSAYTLFSAATPQAPAGYPSSQFALQADSGSNTNRTVLFRNTADGTARVFNSGTGGATTIFGTWAQSVQGLIAAALNVNSQAQSFNGSLQTNSAAFTPIVPTNLRFGSDSAGAAQFNGLKTKDAIWLTQAIPNSQLQALQ